MDWTAWLGGSTPVPRYTVHERALYFKFHFFVVVVFIASVSHWRVLNVFKQVYVSKHTLSVFFLLFHVARCMRDTFMLPQRFV